MEIPFLTHGQGAGSQDAVVRAKVVQRAALVAQDLSCHRCGATTGVGRRYIHDPYPDRFREDAPPYVACCDACITPAERDSICAHTLDRL